MTQAADGPADVRVLTVEELADRMRERGANVVFGRGRYWINRLGFFRLLHFAATSPAEQLGRPSRACWAYHAVLPAVDAAAANAWTPLHLIQNLDSYDEAVLDASSRKQLRRCRATLRLVTVEDPDLLRKQGWDVFSQNARRIDRDRSTDRARYLAAVDSVTGSGQLVLAVMDGERLLAYLETYAVEDTAYLSEIRLSDEAMRRHVSGFLHFEASQVYRRSRAVTQVCPGPPLPERLGVSEFKRRWGMPIVAMPARFWSPGPFRTALKAAAPAAYYRATGRPARGVASGWPPSATGRPTSRSTC